ncbi:arsenate reductase ArsC [Salinactinospora qingdaonensis]|uniref:Arsenate reductase ArsC n=1 Tax=Salinactinospora qingdaonensis TaxID=702744 RepID=A0ABP7GBP0_9ACTN
MKKTVFIARPFVQYGEPTMRRQPPLPGLLSPQAVLRRVSQRLAAHFTGVFAAETVQRYVDDAYRSLAATASIHAHLPLITERFAAQQLTSVARAEGLLPKEHPTVLFVCDHNAARSQIAAALLARRLPDRVTVHSAGSHPHGQIDPTVLAAMREIGVDLSEDFPKPLTGAILRSADIVVTMGCGDACPVLPGKRYFDWNLSDPLGRPLDEVRAIRNTIDVRVRRLADDLARPRAQEN